MPCGKRNAKITKFCLEARTIREFLSHHNQLRALQLKKKRAHLHPLSANEQKPLN